MPDTFLDLVRAAASHELLGFDSLIDGAATGGSTSTLVDTNLITSANDQSLAGRWLYMYAPTDANNAGVERYVRAVAGDTGTLTFTATAPAAVAAGDQYLLFRDFRFRDWLRFANDVARNVYYDTQVYLRGQTDLLRYTLPVPLSQPGWIEAAWVGQFPFQFSTAYEMPRKIDWYRLDPLNIQGQIYLLLSASIGADKNLVFNARVPYAHPHESPYTMTSSVLVPFGQSDAISLPRNVIVAGMVWRALVQKLQPLSGAARQIWGPNRDQAARWYAQELGLMGAKTVGKEVGYSTRW